MQGLQKQAARHFARLKMRNPEHLWVHYCFALILILFLLTLTHMLISSATNRGLVAAEAVKNSNSQVLIVREIFMESQRIFEEKSTNFSKYNKAIRRLEAIHASILSADLQSDALRDHYFGSAQPLYLSMREYIGLAKQFAVGSEVTQAQTLEQLREVYSAGGLHDGLLLTATLIAEQVKNEATRFTTWQHIILILSGLVLVAEALFIFLPAQIAVQSTIHQMLRQASILRASQTNLKQMNVRLEKLVNHDQLTDLPNRAFLTSQLSHSITRSDLSGHSLLLVGLDNFKSVNDMAGHDYGDALLIAVGRALQSCVDYDSIVARVGGDEFVLVSNEQTTTLARRVMASIAEPFVIKGRSIPINASIGVVEISDAAKEPLGIVADAEIALQFAKNAGGNRVQIFTELLRMNLRLMQKMQLDLNDAIENGEIEPWFQPQVRLSDGRLHGVEVLARWRHPTRGLLTPEVFLPAAERAGLMVDLDHAIWRSAMGYAAQWQDTQIWRPSISLNAAPETISDPDLIERFLLSLQRSGLASDQVVIEVLESTFIGGKDDMAAINIDGLAECGIALELDDFGTGYASLAKLTQLPLTGIKLDRTLVAPLPDPAADSVVRAILALAAELGLHVVAEGIEETHQAEHLNAHGCFVGQGYGFGRPMPPDEFRNWLTINAKKTLHAAAEIACSA